MTEKEWNDCRDHREIDAEIVRARNMQELSDRLAGARKRREERFAVVSEAYGKMLDEVWGQYVSDAKRLVKFRDLVPR